MIRRPVRRLALVTCAVLAAGGLSSCATFTDNTVVARVGDEELDADRLEAVVQASLDYDVDQQRSALGPDDTTVITTPDVVSGAQMRSFIARWIQYEAVEQMMVEEGLTVTDADIAASREEVLAGISGDAADVLVEYAAWQFAVEAKYGTRTATTDPAEYVLTADVYVDPYYGTWNPATGTVDPFGGDA